MKKLRIALVVAVYPPYGGGIGMVAAENAKMLSKTADVTVFSPRYPRIRETEKGSGAFSACFEKRLLTPFLLQPLFSFGNGAVLPQLIWKLRTFDCIHLHYPFFGGVFPALIASLIWRKKLVITYHMDLLGGSFPFRLIFGVANALAPQVMNFASIVFVTSRDYAENSTIGAWAVRNAKKIVELPNSVDTVVFCPQPRSSELLARYGIERNDPIILFVGGLDTPHYFKGVDILLKACAQLAGEHVQYQLLIVGDGDLRSRYELQAQELGIAQQVHFVGALKSREELVCHYALADFVVLPSIDRSEAFGVVLIEAAACGKAVVATDLPGVRSVVEDGITGFLAKAGDAEHLAEKMRALLVDKELRGLLGENGLKRVREKYSNDVVANTLTNAVRV